MRFHHRRAKAAVSVFAAGLLLVVMTSPASAMAGDLDPSFARTGKVTTDFFGSDGDLAYAVAVQTDGRIVAGGRAIGPNADYDFALARYTTAGARDDTFDGDGRVLTGFVRGTASFNDTVYGLALQSDGKIVAAGCAGPYLALARYTTAGQLDTTFSGDGKQLITFGFAGTGFNVANDVEIQADGRIVVGGEGWNGTDYDFALARFNSNGSLDTSFGTGGKVLTDFGSDDHGRGVDIAIGGEIVMGGVVGTSLDYDIAVARYTTAGQLDTTFSGDGKKIVTYPALNGIGNDVAVDPNSGRIIVAGTVSDGGLFDFALVRLKPSGQLIGKGQTDLGAQDLGEAVVIQPNGRIVIAGLGDDQNFGLARYTPNGGLDPLFGVGGKVITDFGSDGAQAKAVAIQPADGKIVAAGERFSSVFGGDFAVARYLAA